MFNPINALFKIVCTSTVCDLLTSLNANNQKNLYKISLMSIFSYWPRSCYFKTK